MRALRLAAAVALWLAAVLLLGMWPRNAGWEPAGADGVEVRVGGTGVHADLVLPLVAVGIDLSGLMRDAGLAPSPWLAVGWGERDFYLHTPTWADADARRLLRAAAGSEKTLLQVTRLGGPDGTAVRLRPDEYRRLVAAVLADVRRPVERLPGYGADDAFVAASGRYWLGRTCNQWVADRLAGAGVRVGSWVPFAGMVRASVPQGTAPVGR
jgi:uncharacterized protein (TIGR02117 family)